MKVYKAQYTKVIPPGAKLIERDGTQYVRYKVRGRTVETRLTRKADRIVVESQYWHIKFRDDRDISRDLKGFENESATNRLANKIEELIALKFSDTPLNKELHKWIENLPFRIRDKLIKWELTKLKTAGKPLTEHIELFREYLFRKERSPRHIKETVAAVKHVFEGCGFRYWTDISAERVKDYLDEQRDNGNGISKRRYNGLLGMVKFFCSWMVKNHYATYSPIKDIEKQDNLQTDVRVKRHPATTDELRRLLEAAGAGPERYGLSGYERRLLYRFAVETGLRANEIRTLKVLAFDFDELTVTVEAINSKHRRIDTLPLRPELAVLLKRHVAKKLPTARAFYVTDKTAVMLRDDLTDAKIPYLDDAGRRFDFHALRHTFITSLRNVPTSVRQALARHRSSAMTDRYTHINLLDERSALSELPDYSQPSSEKKKTGTDDADAS